MHRHLSPEQRGAIRRVLEHPQFELIPMKNALDQAAFLPEGAMVSVTASPVKPLEQTVDLAAELHRMGFDVIPHLSARMTRDYAHLEKIVARLHELGIRKLFVIGGDAADPGEFYDAGAILRALDELGAGFDRIGIAAYPEGHHVFDDETARRALHEKQPHADYLATQICFDAAAITSWIGHTRADGISLPVVLGVPGVADRLKLMRISARIGVGGSLRFLSRHRGLLRSFVEPGGFSPDELLEDLADTLLDPAAGVINIHIYTFNQVETTERWRQDYLASL